MAFSFLRNASRARVFNPSMFTRGFTSAEKFDVVVVGGGPGGYVAAIKAAQSGLKTACVESRGSLGGTCLNVGCIPSKALLNASHHYHDAKHNFAKFGIEVTGLTVDLGKMMKNKEKSVGGLTKGIEMLFKKNKVTYVKGHGKVTAGKQVQVKLNEGGDQTLDAKNIILATGSEPSPLKGVEVDEKRIVTSTGALSLPEIPKDLVVIGGGVIGLELGSVYARLGSNVTVVEYLDRIIPGTDNEIASSFLKILTKQGFKFKLATKVDKAVVKGNKVQLVVSPANGGPPENLEADYVLLSTGRRPFTNGLGLQEAGVEMDKDRVKVNDQFQTNIPGVYAIGDVIRGPMLAHKAEEEGIAAVEYIAGKHGHVDYKSIPGVIYTWPEVATVGQTEEQLKEAGTPYKKGVFPFIANSRAKTNDDYEGMVKVLSHATTDRLLGMHIIGPNAGELIIEGTMGIAYEGSAEDLARTCHAHPTFSEAVKEACMAAYDKPIHM